MNVQIHNHELAIPDAELPARGFGDTLLFKQVSSKNTTFILRAMCVCCYFSKMERDIATADKTAKKQQKNLAQTSAANKAEDIASLDGASGHGSGSEGEGGDDNSDEVKNIMEDLAKRTPEEVFQQFDTDGSGLIDFDEFRVMLPQLGINISMPKVKTKKATFGGTFFRATIS